MSLKLYRPTPRGLEPNPVEVRTWRSRLGSRRWKPGEISNPEFVQTSNRVAVLFWVVLAVITFAVLVVGYGTGFWGPVL